MTYPKHTLYAWQVEKLKQDLWTLYNLYSYNVRRQFFKEASYFAKHYNTTLKMLGGVSENPGENYLTLGRGGK